jgi:hypothetical protein
MRKLLSNIPNAAIAAVLILPGIFFANPDYLANFPPEHQAGLVFLSSIGVWGMWAFAVQLVRVTARELYFPNPMYVRLSKARVLLYAAASYFLTIYAFSIAFTVVQQQAKILTSDKAAFSESLNGLVDALYFSIITIATVGYGDITPKTQLARILVSFEVLAGVGYSVFFFSIIAGFIREHDTSQFSEYLKRRTRRGASGYAVASPSPLRNGDASVRLRRTCRRVHATSPPKRLQ